MDPSGVSDGSHNPPSEGLFDGRYRIIRPVGQGGMARVLLAEDADLHRPVALKILSGRYAGDAAFVERFTREARAVAALNHPNIVQIYDRGTVNGQPYIAMEYVEGETLKHLISRDAPLPPKRVIDIALQILAALRSAHKKDVIHRDIKPQNILLLADGRVKVTDFGIARAGASEMTEEGSVVGTAQYLAPEQARGLAVGPSADLYSTGVVIYEMLTGRVPFLGDSSVAIAMKHVQERPTPPRLVTPGIPPELEAVVMRALEKDPLLRYRTADEMGVELDRVRRALGNGGVTEATTVLPSEQRTAVVPPPRPRPVPPPMSGREIDLRQPGQPPPVRPVVPAYYDDEDDLDEARRSWPWLILIALLGIAAALALAMWQSGRGDGTSANTGVSISIPASSSTISTTEPTTATTVAEVSVPRVIGMPLDDATRILTNAKLQFNFTRQPSDKPKDEVVDQSPAAGELVREGEVIELTVSNGVETVPVPNVVGMTYEAALQALTDANLGAKRTEEASGDVAAGRGHPDRASGRRAGRQGDGGHGRRLVGRRDRHDSQRRRRVGRDGPADTDRSRVHRRRHLAGRGSRRAGRAGHRHRPGGRPGGRARQRYHHPRLDRTASGAPDRHRPRDPRPDRGRRAGIARGRRHLGHQGRFRRHRQPRRCRAGRIERPAARR